MFNAISDIILILANIATVIAAIVAIAVFSKDKEYRKREYMRTKKQATLDAINVLQSEVFDSMSHFSKSDIKKATEDPKCEGYRQFGSMLARCEHFSVGVKGDIYDYATTKELAGSYLWPLYEKFIPLIEAKRMVSDDKDIYLEFQKLAVKLKKECDHGSF